MHFEHWSVVPELKGLQKEKEAEEDEKEENKNGTKAAFGSLVDRAQLRKQNRAVSRSQVRFFSVGKQAVEPATERSFPECKTVNFDLSTKSP